MTDTRRNSYAWQKLSRQRRAIARANDEPCSRCGRPFQWDAHPNSAAACTTDHPDPIAYGGQLLPPIETLGVHHRRCGGHQGAAISNQRQGTGPGSRGGKGDWTPRKRSRPARPDKHATTATCEWCGCTFQPWRKTAGKYCSRECWADARTTTATWEINWQARCAICDQPMTTTTVVAEDPQQQPPSPPKHHTCSRRCSNHRSSIQAAIRSRDGYRTQTPGARTRPSKHPGTTPEASWEMTGTKTNGIPERRCRHETREEVRTNPINPLADSQAPRYPAAIVSDISTPFTECQRNPGEFDSLPLIFPPPHPDAVGSHGDAFVAAAEARMRSDRWTRGDGFRWWQWLVAQRLLEHRADGSWCHPLSLVSVPRQQGKTELLDELAVWRASCGEASGIPHEVGHSASTVVISRLTQSSRWQWAMDSGLTVARQLGDSQIRWPGGSVWRTMAPGNMFGRSLGTILGDEAWSWSAEDFWQATYPTVAERPDALVVLFSAAHDAPKSLLGTLLGNPMVCVMLWGAPAGADDGDPAVWRAATPFWSENRERVMRMAAGEPSFASQWLNRWPEIGAAAGPAAVSGGEWSAAGRPGVEVPAKQLVVGISKEADDRWPVVVAGRTADGAVAVRLVGVYGALPDAQAAAAGAAGHGPWLVAPAFPLKGQVELRRAAKTFWLSDTELSAAVAMCAVRLRSGELVHDPGDEALSAAVLAVPLRLPRGECGTGVLAMAAAAFAFRSRGASSVVV